MDTSCLTCKHAEWSPKKIGGLTYGKCLTTCSHAESGKIAALIPYDKCPKWEEKITKQEKA